MKEVDIAVLKSQVKELQNSVDRILNNHLPHLQDKLDKIETKIAYYSGGLAVLTIVVPIIINLLFK